MIFKPPARRHAPAAGHSAEEIESAIEAELARASPDAVTPFHRVVPIHGKVVKDTGIKRGDTGVVEIGTDCWWTRRGWG